MQGAVSIAYITYAAGNACNLTPNSWLSSCLVGNVLLGAVEAVKPEP